MKIKVLLITAALAALTLLGTAPAHAGTPSPSPSATPDTVTCVWQLGPGSTKVHPFVTPQTLVRCDSTAHVPTTCGAAFQVDVYHIESLADQTTLAELEAAGVLRSPRGDSSLSPAPVFITVNAACETSPAPTPTPTTTTPTAPTAPTSTPLTSSAPPTTAPSAGRSTWSRGRGPCPGSPTC